MNLKWEPAIYEHKAALIGRRPAEVANSAELLTAAVLREYAVYCSDYITVGLDVYNVEAEALGAQVVHCVGNECPELAGPLYDLDRLPEPLALPEMPGAGRFGLLLAAGRQVQDTLGHQTRVRVAASGPVTMAAKLAGLEPLIMSLAMEDGQAARLLEFTTQIAEAWGLCLRQVKLDVVFFDSMVAPPIFSPAMYERFALPLHRRLMACLRDAGQPERELVIGGDSTPITGFLKRTGANILLCDYAADAAAFRAALGDDTGLGVRRNLNPATLTDPADEQAVERFRAELALFSQPIAGTGILPYDFNPNRYLSFRTALETGAA